MLKDIRKAIFEKMNNFKSNLVCSFCNKIYKDPIELSCGDLICHGHLTERDALRQNNKIKFQECKLEFDVKGIEFKLNKFAQNLLSDNVHLNNEEISLKQKIEESIQLFYQMYDEFISSKT